jgi:general secretion pathway protein N
VRAGTFIAVVGIPAYVVFLLLLTPATSMVSRIAAESPPGLAHFSDARGTLWHGSLRAQLEGTGGTFACDEVAWRFIPWDLLQGRVAFNVKAQCPDANGDMKVSRGWSGWEAKNVAASLKARALPAFFPLVAAWRPEGTITAISDGLRWNERELHGPVSLTWTNASVALSEVKPLGSYRLAAQGDGDTVKLVLTTLDGALRMAGQGEVKLPRTATFSGDARAEGANAAALEPILNLIGPRRPDGARSIEVRIR